MYERLDRPTKRARQLRNNATDAERKLWSHLSHRQLGGHKFSRQRPIGPFICDFLCRERGLVIEVGGGQHSESNADLPRTTFLWSEGLTILRFWNDEVLTNMDGVLTTILASLERLPAWTGRSNPQPLPQAGGEQS
jgi:very-short-patch-repair endonuclease